MDTMETLEDQESRLNYLIRKYGRVTLILTFFMLLLLEFTGVRSDMTSSIQAFASSGESPVAIQGSKKVNPPITSEYWTSSKFNF